MQVYRHDEGSKHQVLMDSLSHNEGEPAKFIRELKEKSSILMFYEEKNYAKSLGFLFLDIGLRGSQACLYLSSDTIPNAEAFMAAAGINVAESRPGSLQIHTTNSHKKDQIIRIIEEFVKSAKDRASRIIIHHDRFTREQQSDLLLVEEFMQELFERHDVSVLSIYNTEFMDNAQFMQQIINVHDYTIFAPDFGKGIVVKMR
ncbi:MAG: hypothetical protein EPO62_04515 [Candidatus Nitrosotenuis sp.]|nr:MAG: hypothetical protein EPO62_04515 [Candidatus Nitrosotenuis sp.]